MSGFWLVVAAIAGGLVVAAVVVFFLIDLIAPRWPGWEDRAILECRCGAIRLPWWLWTILAGAAFWLGWLGGAA